VIGESPAPAPSVELTGAPRGTLHTIVAAEDLERLLPHAVQMAAGRTASDYAAIALLRADHTAYARYHHTGPGGQVVELSADEIELLPTLISLCRTEAAINVPDLSQEPVMAGFPPCQPPASALLSLPLRSGRRALGHLLLARSRPEPYGPAEEAAGRELAEAVAAVLRRLRAEEQLATLRLRSQRLARTNLALMRQVRPEGALQWAVNDVRSVLDAEIAALVLTAGSEAGDAPTFYQSGLAPGRAALPNPLDAHDGAGLLRSTMGSRRPLRLAGLSGDPRDVGFPGDHARVTSFVSAPLVRRGQVIGLLYAANKRRASEFSEDDERFLAALAAELARSRLPGSQSKTPDLVDRIADASKALRREMETTRSFLANLSHELRGSISGILLSADLLTDPVLGVVGDAERVSTVAHRIHSVAGNLLELVDNLLDLGRLEAGRLDVRFQPVDLSAVLDDVEQVIAPLAGPAGINVEWPSLARVPRLVADPIRLRQVLVNLLTNAVKFTASGGRVWMEIAISGDRVTLSVCDTGKGIAESEMERIFQPFERAAPADVPGVGLGLAISRRILELHGTSLEVESQPGEGSRFSFGLRQSREPLAPRLLRPVRNGDSGGAQHASILLVEDDPVNRQSISDILTAAGHRVRSVETRAQALESMARWPAEVVVLDVQLPDGSGLDIVDALRASSEDVVAVVALSADRIGNTADLAMQAGCDRFGLKPIAATTLLELVTEARRERRSLALGRPLLTVGPSE
jgi:signal transduction histidine kinase/ActR/RegA family two-component response regulator